jgi:hypothetical protein
METALRLRDCTTQTYFVVDMEARQVYVDRAERGSIGPEDKISGDIAERVLDSACGYQKLFARPVPGNRTPDDKFEVRGCLTRSERAAFAAGHSVPAERAALLLHLDFFDRDLDGKISLAENYRGWRCLGFPKLAALGKAALSAALFGKVLAKFAVDIERIGAKRYAHNTGLYDNAGRIDQARLAEYLAFFDAKGEPLTFDETLTLLRKLSAPGFISRSQFRSLFSVCKRLNKGAKVVTKAQFRGLFDGSLLWLAAATTNDAGRRPQDYGKAWLFTARRAAVPSGSQR